MRSIAVACIALVALSAHAETLDFSGDICSAAAEGTGVKVQLRRHPGHDHSYWFIQSVVADHLRHHARGLGLART